MDMLYYIYIGNDRSTINHLSKVTGGMFMAVSSSNKAAKVIDSIRERYNTSILYEQNEPLKDSQDISFLHKRFPRVYIILITPGLQTESRKVYLQAGVNNTLPPQADEESIRQMTKFLQLRKEHKATRVQPVAPQDIQYLPPAYVETYLRYTVCVCSTHCAFSATHCHSNSYPHGE